MAAIHRNMRALRCSRGLTKAAAAEAISLSTQEIKDLESGKKQAEPALLDRFAALYGVPQSAVLYGETAAVRRAHIFWGNALTVAVLFLTGMLLRSILITIMNTWFVFADGTPATEQTIPLIEARFALRDAAALIGRLSTGILLAGSAALLVPWLWIRQAYSVPERLAGLGGFLFAAAAVTLPFAWRDAAFGVTDYLAPVLDRSRLLWLLLLFLAAGIAAQKVRRQRAEHPAG